MNRRTNLLRLAVALAVLAGGQMGRASEPPGRLVVNGDGTVTDTVTQLVWEQANNPTSINSLADAAAACSGLSLGAFTSGWRLPTVKELVSIVDYESPTAPMIDTAAFPNTATYFESPYYTATVNSGGSGLCVNFGSGQVTTGYCGGGAPLRCVHSGS